MSRAVPQGVVARVDRAARGPRPPTAWIACFATASSVLLAWGAVSPVDRSPAHRVGIVPGTPAAWASALAVVGISWWLARRGRAGSLWLAAVTLLPWVPAPALGATLLWHGPLAHLLLGVVALLLVWPALVRAAAFILARPPRQQVLTAWLIAAILYGAAAWRMQPQLPDGDEPHYLVITQSLLLDRDLRIENNHRRGDYAAYTARVLKPDTLRRGQDGQIYSVHAPGTSVLVLPAFALGGYPAVVTFLVLLAACGAALLWDTAWRLTGSPGAAWAGWAGASLSAPFYFHAFMVFPDAPGAVLVMAIVAALVVPERLLRTGSCAGIGVAIAALPWLHTRFALVAGIAGLLVMARVAGRPERRMQRICACAAAPLVSIAGWLWFFYILYGTINPAAPYGGYTQTSLANVPRGLAGLLLDQQFGLLPNAPSFAAALAGLVAVWRANRRLALEFGLLLVPYAIAVACYHMWWGGRSAPARFLVVVLLPLGLGIAAWWHRAPSADRAAIGATVMASLALSFVTAWVDRGALVFNVRDGYALWADAAAPLVRWPLALPSLFRESVLEAAGTAVAWTAACAAGLVLLRRLERSIALRERPHGDGWRACVTATVVLVVAGGSAAGWAVGGADSIDTGNGLLRVVRTAAAGTGRGWRSRHPLTLDAAPAMVAGLELPSPRRRLVVANGAAWTGTDVPPGRYEVSGASGVNGRIEALFGGGGTPLAQPSPGLESFTVRPEPVRLPAGATVLRITTDPPPDHTSAGAIRLRLAEFISVPGLDNGVYANAVLRAHATLWFVDGNAFVETGGFWVRGGAETIFVVDGGRAPAELVVRAGPVSTACTVTLGGAAPRVVTLGPGMSEIVALAAPGATAVRVGSTAGFRPRDFDPANPDARWLGVRVEIR